MYSRWNTYSSYLKGKYGEAVYRIGVDGGFSCPNRDKERHGGCAFCDDQGIGVLQSTTAMLLTRYCLASHQSGIRSFEAGLSLSEGMGLVFSAFPFSPGRIHMILRTI